MTQRFTHAESTSISTVMEKTTMSTKSMKPEEKSKETAVMAGKSASTKASWQEPETFAPLSLPDGTQNTIAAMTVQETDAMDWLARLQDLCGTVAGADVKIFGDNWVIAAFPIVGLNVSKMQGRHGKVFAVNGVPVVSLE